MSMFDSIPILTVTPQNVQMLLLAGMISGVLSVVLVASLLLCQLTAWSQHDRGLVNRKSRTHEFPSEYAFTATTAVRALETTYLPYIAPPRPDVRRAGPIIFRAFARAGKQRLAQDGIPLDQKMARPVSYSHSATPLPSASVPASSPHVHTTPQHVQTADGMDSSASQSPRGSRVRFVDDHAGGERRVTPLAPSVLPIDWSDDKYKRHEKPFRNGGTHEPSMDDNGTFWFQLKPPRTIQFPPAEYLQCPTLRPGDLFYNGLQNKPQLWLCSFDADNLLHWISVCFGYQRNDGRRLVLTDSYGTPSWVSPATYTTKYTTKYKSRLNAS